jgi:hypothetical protein
LTVGERKKPDRHDGGDRSPTDRNGAASREQPDRGATPISRHERDRALPNGEICWMLDGSGW